MRDRCRCWLQMEDDARRKAASKAKKRTAEDRRSDQLKSQAAKFRLFTVDTPTKVGTIEPDTELQLIAGPASRTLFLRPNPATVGDGAAAAAAEGAAEGDVKEEAKTAA